MFFLILTCLFVHLVSSQPYPTFEDYAHDFQKSYSSPEQRAKRKQIYEEKIAGFSQITLYTPGVNNLTDWTQQQLAALKSSSLIKQINNIAVEDQTQQVSFKAVSAPKSLDWRTSKAVTSVKQQGSCGSCWAFAAVAHVQSKLIIQKGYNQNLDLSEQYLVSCTSGSNCIGGYIEDALKLVAQGGIPYEASFPYNPYGSVSPQICSTKNKVTEAGNKYRYIRDVSDQVIINLLQRGPLPVGLSGDKWETYGSGIFVCPKEAKYNHAALLVGYTQNQWILKNQWGRTWGESGYIRITRSRTEKYMNCFIGSSISYLEPVESSNYSIHLVYFWGIIILMTFSF